MPANTLLPDAKCLRCDKFERTEESVTICVSSTATTACCPNCGRPSGRIHSRYDRLLADLPWHGVQVTVRWQSRKFFCDAFDCPRRIFTERLPMVAAPHARKTARLQTTLLYLGLACGGEGGARLCERLGMVVSPDSLLRNIRSAAIGESESPRVVGIDDWAFRRGQRYGTIVCDLERRRPIELLPERSPETVRDWLARHPGVEIVSRDRGDCYIKGVTDGAPKAVQVADRWHLLKNAHEALMRTAERHPQPVRQAACEAANKLAQQPAATIPTASPDGMTTSAVVETESRKRRRESYLRIRELRAHGVSLRAIAKQLGMSRATIRRYARADSFPEPVMVERRRRVDAFTEELRRRWNEGCRNAAQLTRELRGRGFRGSYNMVRRQVAAWRKGQSNDGVPPQPSRCLQAPSAKQVAWLLLKSADLDDDERLLVEGVHAHCPELHRAARLAIEFGNLVRGHNAAGLDDWLERCRGPDAPPDLHRFAEGLRADYAAVRAALESPWSNGQTEGQINRLKLVKRQMYGRAKLDLLRQRFLLAI